MAPPPSLPERSQRGSAEPLSKRESVFSLHPRNQQPLCTFTKKICSLPLYLSFFPFLPFSPQLLSFKTLLVACTWAYKCIGFTQATLGFQWKMSCFYFLGDLIWLKRWALHMGPLSLWETWRETEKGHSKTYISTSPSWLLFKALILTWGKCNI